jgi:hypothetical protein
MKKSKTKTMSKERYLRKDDLKFYLDHVVEEFGEALSAIGKANRWGLDSVNPELPREEQETNRAWATRKLIDAREAIDRALWLLASEEVMQTYYFETTEDEEPFMFSDNVAGERTFSYSFSSFEEGVEKLSPAIFIKMPAYGESE